VISLLLLSLYFSLPRFVPVTPHVRCVPSQTQSIWLGHAGRDPSMQLDTSQAPVFGTVTCSLEELRLWERSSTFERPCLVSGFKPKQHKSVNSQEKLLSDLIVWHKKAVKIQSNKSKFCLRDVWAMLIKPPTCIQGRIWHTQAYPFFLPI